MEMAVLGSEAVLKRALADVPPKLIPGGIKGGDTKVIWDAKSADEIETARRTFDDLRSKGYAAFAVKKDGEKGEMITKFDPTAEKLILAPQMRGGV